VGSSLQSEIDIYAGGAVHKSLSRLGDDLRFVLITSRATLHSREGAALDIQVTPSPHQKCERCWHYRADVGADTTHPHICGRCVSNLYGAGEPRQFA
jgi:isoleucyl-tRNA synthetase